MTFAPSPLGRQPRRAGRVLLPVALAVLLLCGVFAGLLRSGNTQAATATLRVALPAQVVVGEPFEVGLIVDNASGIAAYETRVLFNTTRATLRNVDHDTSSLVELGRDVRTLGPVEVPGGFAIGAFSLPGNAGGRGAEGTARLATITLVPNQTGTLQLSLASFSLAGVNGQPLEVALPQTSFSVQVVGGQP
jgi:hypothetical protein